LLKEEEKKLRCGGRMKQGCEGNSRHILAWKGRVCSREELFGNSLCQVLCF